MDLHVNAQRVQNKILVDGDGQPYLKDFGIVGMFTRYPLGCHGQEMLQYMAPERLPVVYTYGVAPSKESDVYSLAMTAFSVCTPFGNYPTT